MSDPSTRPYFPSGSSKKVPNSPDAAEVSVNRLSGNRMSARSAPARSAREDPLVKNEADCAGINTKLLKVRYEYSTPVFQCHRPLGMNSISAPAAAFLSFNAESKGMDGMSVFAMSQFSLRPSK